MTFNIYDALLIFAILFALYSGRSVRRSLADRRVRQRNKWSQRQWWEL